MTGNISDDNNCEESNFEKSYTLKELLPTRNLTRLAKAINQIGLDYFDIVDTNGNSLLSKGTASKIDKIALAPELEVIGFLQFNSNKRKLAEPAANFILEIIQTNWRYQMASSIHLQVTQSDFDELVEKNKLLAQSESRYKELSESLEDRVKSQLKIIEESQRQLYETEKMASVGQLAAGVAHEINNPIGFISSNLHTASEYLGDIKKILHPILNAVNTKELFGDNDIQDIEFLMQDFDELLSESLDGAKRVSAIVADLKAFSNIDHSEDVYIDLRESIERVGRVFLTSVNRDITLTTDIQPVSKTYCKPGHINQLLLNLLHNSANAITSQGLITLTCRMENDKLLIGVCDDGKGMTEETKRKAFEPFYTTHDVGGGTGLGLTVSRDVVNAHHGEISIQSELGKGTRIYITLPVIAEPGKL